MVLLCLQSTPIDHAFLSPSKLLFNRKFVGNLQVKCPNNLALKEKIATCLYQRQSDKKSQHNKDIRDLPSLLVGQSIQVLDQGISKWSLSVITYRCVKPKSYIVQTSSGKLLCRNQKHLREDKSTATMNPEVSTPPPVTSPESI